MWDYKPDIILLAFFSGNDISDNSKILSNKNYRPFFVYKNNDLVLDNSFRKSKSYLLLKSWTGQTVIKLTDYSRIAQFLKEIYIKQHLKKQKKIVIKKLIINKIRRMNLTLVTIKYIIPSKKNGKKLGLLPSQLLN